MVSLPVSHVTRAPAPRTAWLSAAAAWGVDVFGLIGASMRVARAAEMRVDPDPVDLKKLGIKGPLPKAW